MVLGHARVVDLAQLLRVVRQQRLLRTGGLEGLGVGRTLVLVFVVAHRVAERVEVRYRDRRQGADPVRVRRRHRPGDRRAPVVSDQVEALPAEVLGDGQHIAEEFLHPVVGHLLRPHTGGIAALIRGDREALGTAEHRQLLAPLHRRLREAVQQQHRTAVLGTGRQRVELPGRSRDLDVLGHPATVLVGEAADHRPRRHRTGMVRIRPVSPRSGNPSYRSGTRPAAGRSDRRR